MLSKHGIINAHTIYRTRVFEVRNHSSRMHILFVLHAVMSTLYTTKLKLYGLSPRVNYTDQATALVGKVIANFCG
jgi:hypothetical protein